MAARLYDFDSKQWVQADDADIASMVGSGRYAMESGVDIPVVGSDGNLQTVKSDDAYHAFAAGARLATADDKTAWEQKQQDAILEKHYGDETANALAAGTLRGATFGLSDLAAPAIAGELGYDAGAVKQGLSETKERNPVASTVGQMAGLTATSFATPIGGIGAATEEAAGVGAAKIASALGEGAIATPAARLVSTLAPAAIGSAAEGAVYGLGDGISEASLGKPEDVASNLVAGVTLGGITGGVFGAAIGGGRLAKPFLSKAIDASANAAENATKYVARKMAKGQLIAAANDVGDTQAAELIAKHGLIDSDAGQQVRELVQSGEYKQAETYAKEIGKHEQELRNEAARLETGARSYLTQLPKAEAADMKQRLEASAFDAVKARNQAAKEYSQADALIRQETASLKGPAVYGKDITDKIERLLTKATDTGDAAAVQRAQEIRSVMEAQLSSGNVTEGQEINGLRNVKNAIQYGKLGRIPDADAKKAFIDVSNTIKDALSNHPRPFIADTFTEGDKIYQSVAELGKLIGKQNPRMSAINSLLIDPDKQQAALGFISKIGEYVPEINAFGSTLKDATAQKQVLASIKAKLTEGNINSSTSKIELDDIKDIIHGMGLTKGGIQQRLQRIDTIKGVVDGLDGLNPMEKAVRLERAVTGGPSTLEKYLPHMPQIEALQRLQAMKEGRDTLLQKGIRGGIGFAAGHLPGAAYGVLVKPPMSPHTILQTLNKVERAAYQGTRRVANVMKATVDAVTSDTALKASRIAAGVKVDQQRFDDIKHRVQSLGTPQAMADALSAIDASATPQLHSALSQKIITAQRYLQQTMPKDPLEGYSLKAGETSYKPSDLDMSRYMRRVEAVNDPIKVVERVGQGTVTREEIDALKYVHPEVFQQLQTQLFNGIITATKPVAYQNKLMLKQVFGIPTDYSLRPEFTAAMQANHAAQAQGGRPQEGVTSQGDTKTQSARKPIDLQVKANMTPSQQLELPES